MVTDLPKRKGMSQRSKDQIAGKITEVVVQNLKPGFARLSENSAAVRFNSDESILTAFPEHRQIVELIAEMSWVGKKFSVEYIERTIGSTVVKIVRNSNATTFVENVSKYVYQMVTELVSFEKEYEVYVPLEGLTFGQDLPGLQIGDANLVKMDETKIAELLRSLSKDEFEIDVLQRELEKERLESIIKILQKQNPRTDLYDPYDRAAIYDPYAGYQDDFAHRTLRLYQRTNLAPLEKSLDQKRFEILRRREPIISLKGNVCARYSYAADAKKALEYAEESAASLVDLLRYALSVVQAKGKGLPIGLQGEIARGHRTMLAITSDRSHFEIAKSALISYQPFKITKECVSLFEEAGIFDLARLLSRSHGSLTEIEELLKRCIRWFSLSQMQADSKSEFLSLVIILEVLLTPSDRGAPISASIADGAAILIADSEGERKEIRRITKEIYNTRSDIVHGSLTSSAEIDTNLADLRNIVFKLIPVVLELNMRGKLKNNAKSDLMDLINSAKFQGPSVLT
jgi:hypothetical protein